MAPIASAAATMVASVGAVVCLARQSPQRADPR